MSSCMAAEMRSCIFLKREGNFDFDSAISSSTSLGCIVELLFRHSRSSFAIAIFFFDECFDLNFDLSFSFSFAFLSQFVIVCFRDSPLWCGKIKLKPSSKEKLIINCSSSEIKLLLKRKYSTHAYITLFYLTGRAELTFKFTWEHSIS